MGNAQGIPGQVPSHWEELVSCSYPATGNGARPKKYILEAGWNQSVIGEFLIGQPARSYKQLERAGTLIRLVLPFDLSWIRVGGISKPHLSLRSNANKPTEQLAAALHYVSSFLLV